MARPVAGPGKGRQDAPANRGERTAMSFLKSTPDASLMDVFRRWPGPGATLTAHADAIMRGDGPLDRMTCEVIGAWVSGLNHCEFCEAAHTVTAGTLGAPAGLVRDLLERPETADVPEKLRVLLDYLRKLTLDPATLTAADAGAVFAAGWDDDGLFQAVSVCALFGMMNRLVHGLGVPADPETVRTAGLYMAEHGYGDMVPLLQRLAARAGE